MLHKRDTLCMWGTVIVCGSRDYDIPKRVWKVLDKLRLRVEDLAIRTGGGRGADRHAERWAERRGVPLDRNPADWSLGPAAGPRRNAYMLVKEPKPCAVVAFWPGPSGTYDMVDQARGAGLPVWTIDWAGILPDNGRYQHRLPLPPKLNGRASQL